MTFNQLRARYESATPAERQQVLDRLASNDPLDWEIALRSVFQPDWQPEDLSDVTGPRWGFPARLPEEPAACLSAPEPLALERTDQGWNYVLPGTAPSAHQAAAARGPKIRPPTKQREPAGMFAIEAQTPDLFS